MKNISVGRHYLKYIFPIFVLLTVHYIYWNESSKSEITLPTKFLTQSIHNGKPKVESAQPIKIFNASRENKTPLIIKSTMQQSIPSNHPAPKSNTFKPIILYWTTWYHPNQSNNYFGFNPKTKCKIPCKFTQDRSLVSQSHAILFHGWTVNLLTSEEQINGTTIYKPKDVPELRHKDQFYIFVTSEAPLRNKVHLEAYREFFNWTVSYRTDSDFLLADGKFVPFSKPKSFQPDRKLANRPELVAWLVSNCWMAPSNRNQLVKTIQKYIPVNIYGKCGDSRECKGSIISCYKEIGKTHKFYLSFENSYCKDYVTEKFFAALHANMVPIVFGNADYKRQFPPNSFINVDSFSTPKELADYLKYLDRNDQAYLKFFDWKKHYYIQPFRQNNIYCDVCERVYNEYSLKTQTINVDNWYFGNNSHPVCTTPKIKF